jgi:hypothetical protein
MYVLISVSRDLVAFAKIKALSVWTMGYACKFSYGQETHLSVLKCPTVLSVVIFSWEINIFVKFNNGK